jgi:carbamoylphosphate synthase large subunit
MTITQEDVQRLMDAEADDAVLVLIEGTTLVLSAADLDSDRYRGASTVARKSDIVKESGSLSEHERREVAARLDVEVSQRGG